MFQTTNQFEKAVFRTYFQASSLQLHPLITLRSFFFCKKISRGSYFRPAENWLGVARMWHLEISERERHDIRTQKNHLKKLRNHKRSTFRWYEWWFLKLYTVDTSWYIHNPILSLSRPTHPSFGAPSSRVYVGPKLYAGNSANDIGRSSYSG